MNSLKGKFAQNMGWLLAGRIYQILLNLAVSVLSVRYLGPENYGLLHYAAAISALLSAFCNLGLKDVMVHELTCAPENRAKLLGTALVLRLAAGGLSVLTLGLLLRFLLPQQPLGRYVTLLYCGGLVLQSLETVQFFYQQQLLSRIPALVTMLVRTVVAAYKLLLLAQGAPVTWFAAANMLDHGLFGLLLLLLYLRRGQLGFDWALGRQLLGRSHHFIWSALAVALYGQMDKLMLKHLLSDLEVGYYSAALTLSNLWQFLLAALVETARPVILQQTEPQQFDRQLAKLYSTVLYLSLAAGLGLTLLARPLVALLYGAAYLPAVPALQILAWLAGFSYLGVARSIYLLRHGCQRWEKYLAGLGAVCNGLLNLLLIPRWGICGGAAATLITQILTNFAAGFLFGPLRPNGKLVLRGLAFWKQSP